MTEQFQDERGYVSPGYLTLTGKRLNQWQCDILNSVQRRVLAYTDAGLAAPDHLLNSRHKLFLQCAYASLTSEASQ